MLEQTWAGAEAAARMRDLWAIAGVRAAKGSACDRMDACRRFLGLQKCLEGMALAADLWMDFALIILILCE